MSGTVTQDQAQFESVPSQYELAIMRYITAVSAAKVTTNTVRIDT